jgi:hypothetical protein
MNESIVVLTSTSTAIECCSLSRCCATISMRLLDGFSALTM